MRNLNLGVVGNCSVGALVDEAGEIAWACLPRFDADAVFCSLLRERGAEDAFGFLAVELDWLVRTEQSYVPNTPVLLTRLHDDRGGAVEIVDFALRCRRPDMVDYRHFRADFRRTPSRPMAAREQ